jgi:ABC-type uncharacterized transport system substrate-binding protein
MSRSNIAGPKVNTTDCQALPPTWFRQVAVIVATGGGAPAIAAKAATATIPIVFTGGSDPVRLGLVASLGRPGGNATGVVNISGELTTKRLQLLRELVPTATMITVLYNPASPDAEAQVTQVHEAARAIGQQIHVVTASTEGNFDTALTTAVQKRAGALYVTGDPLFTNAARSTRGAGGLMSYGANLPDVHRQAGMYTGRILKGAKPAELPVLQPTKFELVINARTAKARGIAIPPKLLLFAEVIE